MLANRNVIEMAVANASCANGANTLVVTELMMLMLVSNWQNLKQWGRDVTINV